MAQAETDYLIIGSGAVGMAFADTLLEESDAHITIVDRHGKPGGHWNDAYPFVSLHQPSAFYGVNSTQLGSGEIDTTGLNKGYYELATGAEVNSYFEKVMHQRFLPSGRVSYHPMSDYLGDGKFVSLLSGKETQINIRKKTVDATYYGTTVPSTHTPKFEVKDGAKMIPPNALPQLWQSAGPLPKKFVILGAGKTAMDVGVWLLRSGANADDIVWVCPRDSWLLNRNNTQPGQEFFHQTIGGQRDLMAALAAAETADDLFLRLEACGVMLRIDPEAKPSMFHYATISQGEVDILRQIKNVVRMGHVETIDQNGMHLKQGDYLMPAETLYIDCTATAVERRPVVPQFQEGLITLQMIRVPQPAFSAALSAFLEVTYDDDETKNRLGQPIPLPDGIDTYPAATMVNMMNQFQWSQDKVVNKWITQSRLDGFGKMIFGVSPDDEEKMAILGEFRTNAMAAMGNLPKLMAQAGG
ncbi:FAD/NAD(P)-binding protein [Sphingorhabdus sp. EL138]|uniref:NAD(P)-binding protein n=1 Tax=Sphingorhabdus sp. EL138 TaxID=2073156 RepID=UPI000D696112|nr:NAD(P)-binding protein [Sphingorhabdus sp. EL138]